LPNRVAGTFKAPTFVRKTVPSAGRTTFVMVVPNAFSTWATVPETKIIFLLDGIDVIVRPAA